MTMVFWRRELLVAALVVAMGCGSDDDVDGSGGTAGAGAIGAGGNGGTTGGNGGTDGSAGSGGVVDCDTKAANCASQFGSLFTKSNGRADGTLVAVVQPTDSQCTLYNDDHVVLQLSIQGQVQRLVVAVDGVAVTSVSAPLIGPAFSENWHTGGFQLDYPTDLGSHSTDFTLVTMNEAVDFICNHMNIGAPVSVYAYSDGSAPSSAHQIHRNDNYPDGAIVANPNSPSPIYLLFRYANQVF
jgi:hypothetical protein